MTSVICSACTQRIVSANDRVYCFGGCAQILHSKCTDLSSAGLNAMKDNVALKYMCFECRKQQTNINDVKQICSDLLVKVSLLSDTVLEFEKKLINFGEQQLAEFENRLLPQVLTTIKAAIKADKGTNAIEIEAGENVYTPTTSYASVARAMPSIPLKNSKRKASEISADLPRNKKNAAVEFKADDLGSTLRSGKRRKMTAPSLASDTASALPLPFESAPSGTKTLSPVRKTRSIVKIEQTVLFKPCSDQSAEATKKDIREKLNPITFAVREVRLRSNGEVTVRCDSNELAQKLVAAARELLAEKYDIEVQKPLRPRIKLIGFSCDLAEEELIKNLIDQNGLPPKADVKIVRINKNESRESNQMSAVIETEASVFDNLMKMQRVNIGWERCKVVEAVDVRRCYNCSEYGHIASTCNKPRCCPKCAEEHEAKECPADFEKCVNCQKFNAQLQATDAQIDANHSAWSSVCPFYQRRLKNARRRIDYYS